MAKPPVDNVIKTAIVGQQNSAEVVNVIHWRSGNKPDSALVQGVSETVLAAWVSWLLPVLSNSYQLVRVEGLGLQGPGSGTGEAAPLNPAYGEDLIEASDNQQATVLTLSTGLSGRSYRGRMFLPGLPGNRVQDGFITAAYRSTVATSLNNFIVEVNGTASVSAVIVSYEANKQPRAVPLATQITSVISRTAYPGSANRRRPG